MYCRMSIRNQVVAFRAKRLAYVILVICNCIYFHQVLLHLGDGIFGGLDAKFNLYVLEQVFQNIQHARDAYYGQFFFPYEQTLAFSSNLFFFQIGYFPLRVMGFNPQSAFNLLVLANFSVLSIIVFSWSTGLLRHTSLALCVAILSTTMSVPAHYLHMHFQLFVCYYYLGTIVFIELYMRKLRVKYVWFALLSVVAAFLTDPATAIMGYLIVIVYLLVKWRWVTSVLKNDLNMKRLLTLLVGVFTSFTLLIWAAYPYFKVAMQFGYRQIDEVGTYSSRLFSFLLAPPASSFHKMIASKWGYHEATHFPGFLFLASLVLGILYVVLNKRKRYWPYLCVVLVVYVISFGPKLFSTDVPNPLYYIPHYLLPGFRGIRALGRFGLLLFPILSFFVVYMCWKICLRLFPTGWSRIAILILVLSISLDGLTLMKSDGFSYAKETNKYNEWNQVIESGASTIKIPYEPWPSNPSKVTEQMLGILRTQARCVNGYSGFSTPLRDKYERIARMTKLNSEYEVETFINELGKDKIQWLIAERYRVPQTLKDRLQRFFGKDSFYSSTHFLFFRIPLSEGDG